MPYTSPDLLPPTAVTESLPNLKDGPVDRTDPLGACVDLCAGHAVYTGDVRRYDFTTYTTTEEFPSDFFTHYTGPRFNVHRFIREKGNDPFAPRVIAYQDTKTTPPHTVDFYNLNYSLLSLDVDQSNIIGRTIYALLCRLNRGHGHGFLRTTHGIYSIDIINEYTYRPENPRQWYKKIVCKTVDFDDGLAYRPDENYWEMTKGYDAPLPLR